MADAQPPMNFGGPVIDGVGAAGEDRRAASSAGYQNEQKCVMQRHVLSLSRRIFSLRPRED